MVCQICGEKSGFYPLCRECFKLRDEGKVTKCQECGKWKKDSLPLCKDCWLKQKKDEEKKSESYQPSEAEKEDTNFRNKFPTELRTDDGHMVRSRGEVMIDNWLYHQGIVHAYERKVPIKEDILCDFFIPKGNIWIEYWGLDDEKYLKRKEFKRMCYTKYEKNLIELINEDIEHLDDIMPIKLRPYLPSNFSFD